METYRADIGAANDNRTRKKRRVVLAVCVFLLLGALITFFVGRHYLLDGLPALPDKQAMWASHVKPNYTLLDKDGQVLSHRGPYYAKPMKLEELPAFVPDAFLAIEDQRFWEHKGIDRKAIFRALVANTKAGKKVQGGSTLTQQLVKNMVLTREKTYKRKFQEMWLAYQMEHMLSKKEILELYLNRIDLGNRAFGVGAAAQRYFGKDVKDITLAEAAVLASLPKAPTAYDPIKHPEDSAHRALLVLQTMLEQGKITQTDKQNAQAEIGKTVRAPQPYVEERLIGHVFDMAVEQAEKLIGSAHQDLVIQTTIDMNLQKQGLQSLETIISKNEKKRKVHNGALVAIEMKTGAIRALIGGRDYEASKFNRVTQALRQPGSSFKPFVYAAAFEQGYSPATVRVDQITTIGFGKDAWTPENYTRTYRGPMTLREALKLSINTIAAQVGAEIGPDKVVELAKRFGITSPLHVNYSIALGSSEVRLLDMTSAFMVFGNEGVRAPPFLVKEISDTGDRVLYAQYPHTPERVYAVNHARQMTTMLRDVIDTGTGRGAKLGRRQAAGKTGTSQDYRDGWFIGFTSDYAAGVWMGNDDNSPMRGVTGGLLPVDAWKKFMLAAHKGHKYRPLKAPPPPINDAQSKQRIAFYTSLQTLFKAERDLANGKTAKASKAGKKANKKTLSQTHAGADG